MKKFDIGDVVKVIDGGSGATGCNGCIAVITDEKHVNGLYARDEGVNIEIIDDSCCESEFNIGIGGMLGSIWRVRRYGLELHSLEYKDDELTTIKKDYERKDNKTIIVEVNGKVTESTIIDTDGKRSGYCLKRPVDDYDEKIGIMLSIARALEFDDEKMKLILNAIHGTYVLEDWMLSEFSNEELLNEIQKRMIEDGE